MVLFMGDQYTLGFAVGDDPKPDPPPWPGLPDTPPLPKPPDTPPLPKPAK